MSQECDLNSCLLFDSFMFNESFNYTNMFDFDWLVILTLLE